MCKVFVNPGHCIGRDPGAVNSEKGITEAEIAYDIGTMVTDYLDKAGCEVKLLQSDNLYYDGIGENVVQTANDWPADVFVSLHCNAFNGEARGTEIFTSVGETQADTLATCIMQQMESTFDDCLPVRSDWSDGDVDKEAGLIVLMHTDMPAVLVEMAFIDNAEDAKLLMERKDDFARAIARGVTDYLQTL